MDERAFEQRVLELEPRLYRTACAILWNDADAADALQECLLKAWRKRGSLKEEACFNSWITRILINECHTLRYRLRRHKTVSFDEAVGDVPTGEPVDLGLRDALRAVPEHLRAASYGGILPAGGGGYAAHIRSRRAGQGIPGQTEAAPAAG